MLGNLGREFGSQALVSSIDSPDRLQQFLSQQTLQEITLRAGLERALYLDITGISRQYNNAGSGKLAANRVDRVDTAHGGHLQIHEGDVRAVFSELLHSL